MACLLTWKNVVPVFLKSTRALLQVPHRKFTPGSCGDSSSRVPKQGNRSSETARNFLRSAFRLLKFFPQTEHLKTSFLHSIIEIIAIKTKYCSGDAILFLRSRLYGSAVTRLRVQKSIMSPQIRKNSKWKLFALFRCCIGHYLRASWAGLTLFGWEVDVFIF